VTTLFAIGGCAYRQQVDARHAVHLAMQAAACVDSTYKIGEFDYRHTSALHIERCLWLRDKIANPHLRYAVSVDSDITWNVRQLLHSLAHHKPMAVGIAPCRVGGTVAKTNVNGISATDEPGHPNRVSFGGRLPLGEYLAKMTIGFEEVESGGFGLAVFDLAWFRSNWPEPEPGDLSLTVGEDIAFCRAVRKRNGRIRLLPIETQHYAWGENQNR
jgi:hypothetical protein